MPEKHNRQVICVFFPLLILCFFVLQGCLTGGKPPYMVENYLLDYPVPTLAKQIQLDETIKFDRFSIASAYNTQSTIFRTDNYVLDSFNYNRWAVNPADMIAVINMEITLRDTKQSKANKRIVFQKKYHDEQLLTEQSPRGYCQAMSHALRVLSQQISTDVYQAIKTSEN